ncbi:MAG: acyl-CoA transferase [Pseudomonadota bacterium]
MSTVRETALTALDTLLKGLVGLTALRNISVPVEIPADGLLILRDGNPGEPEVLLSPLTYIFSHRAEVEVLVQAGTETERDARFDALLASIAAAIAADQTLGGTCDWVEAEAPEPSDVPIEGADQIKAAVLPVILEYVTNDRLGLDAG